MALTCDDPGIFAREFLEGIERLETTQRTEASVSNVSTTIAGRLLLPKSRCHLSTSKSTNLDPTVLTDADSRSKRPRAPSASRSNAFRLFDDTCRTTRFVSSHPLLISFSTAAHDTR
jgi:hypothetical protein